MDDIISKYLKNNSNFGLRSNNNIIDNLFSVPKRDKGANMPSYQSYDLGVYQQADLLFLPNDGGYEYALVVAEVGNPRLVDAVALKTKTSSEISKAFSTIYKKNKILKIPDVLTVDSGTEFKGSTKEHLEKMGIKVKTAKEGRHRQVAIVERKNQMIGSVIHKIHKSIEQLTGNTTSEWVNILPFIIKEINNLARKNRNNKPTKDKALVGDTNSMLKEGDRVRVILEEPKDVLINKKLHGRFRSSDIRWEPKERIVRKVLLKPNNPVLYLLDGNFGKNKIEPVAYTRNQLQLIPKNEKKPDREILKFFKDNKDVYEIEKIVDYVDEDGVRWFEVKWKGQRDTSWQTRTKLYEDVPRLVTNFEKKNKLKPI